MIYVRIPCRAQKDGIHKEFQRTIDAGVCNYNREMDVLIVISKWEHTQKRASMLKDMHFRNLSQKVHDNNLIGRNYTYLLYL